jgi:hypothetical protein
LELSVYEGERVLDGAGGGLEAAGVVAEGGQVLFPLGDGEALAAAVGTHGADGEQELPGADVQHAVAPGIEQREDGRAHRHADALQTCQKLHAAALAPRGQHLP